MRGQLRLGELEDSKDEHSSPPRRTTPPRRRHVTPRRACDGPRPVFVACF